MMRNLDLVLAFAFQATILDEPVHWSSGLGAACTLVGSICLGVAKLRAQRKSKTDVIVEVKDEATQPVVVVDTSIQTTQSSCRESKTS